MGFTTGRYGWIGIALETTPGVPVSPSKYIPWLECTLQEQVAVIAEKSARGIRDDQGENSQIGKLNGEGQIKINLDPTLSGYLIGLALGTMAAATTVSTGVYNYHFTTNATGTPKTASIIFNRVNDQQIFTYAVVDELNVSVSDGMGELTAKINSRFPVVSTSGTLTTTSGTLFTFRNATIKMGATLAAAANGTPLKVKDFKMTIKNNSQMIHVISGQSPLGVADVDSIAQKDFDVSGQYSLYFSDTVQRDYYKNLSKNAMIITFTGNQIGGGNAEYVQFRIAKFRSDKYKLNLKLDDLAEETVDFQAEYSSADSMTMDAYLQNNLAAY